MKHKLARHSWSLPPVRFPMSLWEEGEDEDVLHHFHETAGLTVCEDDKHIYVEAALPGMEPDEIEMSYENGLLWIRATRKEEAESTNRRFYRKAMDTFSYRVAIPADVEQKQPEATYKNGMLSVVFEKSRRKKSKKIPIKRE
jgi:HSP20 family protein